MTQRLVSFYFRIAKPTAHIQLAPCRIWFDSFLPIFSLSPTFFFFCGAGAATEALSPIRDHIVAQFNCRRQRGGTIRFYFVHIETGAVSVCVCVVSFVASKFVEKPPSSGIGFEPYILTIRCGKMESSARPWTTRIWLIGVCFCFIDFWAENSIICRPCEYIFSTWWNASFLGILQLSIDLRGHNDVNRKESMMMTCEMDSHTGYTSAKAKVRRESVRYLNRNWNRHFLVGAPKRKNPSR